MGPTMIKNLNITISRASQLRSDIFDELIVPSEIQPTPLVLQALDLAMATHPGSRRDRNEDRIAVARIVSLSAEMYTVSLVCDGVGGSESGDQAAALAIASIVADLAVQQAHSLKDIAVALVKRADDNVRNELQGRGTTTLVMLLANASGDIVCANVGDSRAYSWDPSSSKLEQVTIDDTIENELKDLPGNPEALIRARGLRGRLSQAIGESGRSSDELRIQIYTKERFPLGAVLGSDGLWRAAKDFERTVANSNTPTDAARRAIALANWVGGVDNASLIAVGDIDRVYCGRHISGRQKTEITLWSSFGKIKFPMLDFLDDAKSTHMPSKPEKQKRNTKKKESQETDASQLDLEILHDKAVRPKIEVTISEKSKKSE